MAPIFTSLSPPPSSASWCCRLGTDPNCGPLQSSEAMSSPCSQESNHLCQLQTTYSRGCGEGEGSRGAWGAGGFTAPLMLRKRQPTACVGSSCVCGVRSQGRPRQLQGGGRARGLALLLGRRPSPDTSNHLEREGGGGQTCAGPPLISRRCHRRPCSAPRQVRGHHPLKRQIKEELERE